MKRIEFIAPVEAMRGNLSGNQDLKYPTQDNKAYDGPVGNVNYARNYTPRFVGAKIAASGRKYFTTRTKSANHLTAASKKAMAVMGGAGAIIAAILRNKTATVYTGLQAQWIALQGLGDTRSFRKYLSDGLMDMLSNKQASHTFAGPKTPVTIVSNWNGATNPTVTIPNTTLIKFWDELATDGFYFTVEGQKAIAKEGWTFDDLITFGDKNVLGLTIKTGGNYIQYAGRYLMLGEDYVIKNDEIQQNEVYTTSDVDPS